MNPVLVIGVASMLLPLSAAAAPVYKCQAQGRTTYTDRPCASGAQQAELPNLVIAEPPSRSERALAKAHDERVSRDQAERDRDDAQWLEQHHRRKDREARVRKAILAHKVIKSMTRDEVKQALGQPDRVDSGDSFGTAKETWTYVADGKTRTVNFKDGEVTTTRSGVAARPSHGRGRGKR